MLNPSLSGYCVVSFVEQKETQLQTSLAFVLKVVIAHNLQLISWGKVTLPRNKPHTACIY